MTLAELILEQINSDETSFKDVSDNMIRVYDGLNISERQAVDKMFIRLTGWSLASLISKQEHLNKED